MAAESRWSPLYSAAVKPHSLASDTLWNVLSFAVRTVGTLLALAWVARALGPEGQGRFGFAAGLAALVGQVAVWGLGVAMTRFVARGVAAGRPGEARSSVSLADRWLGRSTLVLLAVGIPLAWLLGEDLRGPLVVAVLYAGVIVLWIARTGVAQGLHRFDVVFWGDLFYYALLLASLAPALGSSRPVLWTLVAFLATRAAQVALLWWWTEGILRGLGGNELSSDQSVALSSELRSYAAHLAVIALFGAVLWDRSELVLLKSTETYEALGFYTAALAISMLVVRVPGVLGHVILPAVASMQGVGADSQEVGRVLRRGSRLLSLALVGPVCVLLASTPAWVEVLYGASYRPSQQLLGVLLVPLLLGGVGAAGAKTLVGGGGQKTLLRVTAWTAAGKVWLCVLLIPQGGVLGAALGCTDAQGVAFAVEAWCAARRFEVVGGRVEGRWKQQAGVAALAGVATLAVGLLAGGPHGGLGTPMLLLLQLSAGLVALLAAMRWLRPLPLEDRTVLGEGLAPWLQGLLAGVCEEAPGPR